MIQIGGHLWDIDWLKNNHTLLQPFGLGFLQLKLNDTQRMHFWHPGFSREREEVHNHRYNFRSIVLVGDMYQELFRFEPSADWPNHHYTHEEFETVCKPGHDGSDDEIRIYGTLKPVFATSLVAGVEYSIDADTLHRIEANRCVTFLQRESPIKTHAKVVREIGTQSTCPFAESVPENEMWQMIEDCLR
jgi:hypothetical protein